MPKADGSTVQAALAAIADRTSAGKGAPKLQHLWCLLVPESMTPAVAVPD